jgi:hypothetical protein
MRILAALAVLAGSICTWSVALIYLVSGGIWVGTVTAFGRDAGFGGNLCAWSAVVFLAALAQLVVALRLLRDRTGPLAAFAAVSAFAVCLFDLHLPVSLEPINWLDSASIVGSFFAFPATLASRKRGSEG